MQELANYIENYFGITGSEIDKVADLFREEEIAKQDFFLRKDDKNVSLSFVRSGMLRIYGYDKSGEKEITQWISMDGMFVTELSSLVFDQPSRFNIQAITDCHLFSISKQDYHRIADVVPSWHQLEKLFIAKCFITLENRVFEQISLTAEEKYLQWFEQAPEMFNIVPLQYIASMLGMSPETLSRIRKKLSS